MASKRELVSDIFLEATKGMRTTDNYALGEFLMDQIAQNNYLWKIKESWKEIFCDGLNPKVILKRLVEWAERNTYDCNFRATAKTTRIHRAYYDNFFRA